MKTATTLPVTAEQSRAARFQLGLTQKDVVEAGELPSYKLKQFETGRFVPDIPFLERLRDFYIERGIDLSGDSSAAASGEKPAAPGATMWRPAARMALYVRDDIPESSIMRIFERMDSNDARVESLFTERLQTAFLGGYSDETEANIRELFGAMAENYIAFRWLQGRNIIGPKTAAKPVTHADVVAAFFAESPIADLVSPPAIEAHVGGEADHAEDAQ